MTSGIYAIVNKINGHRYVGSAVDIPSRWRSHVYHLRKGNHHSKHLQSAWDKYGRECFSFIVLERVDDLAVLIQREQAYLDESLPEYNTNPIAGNMLGYRFSKEAKQRMSEIHTGFRHTDESRLKMSELWSRKPRGEYSADRRAKIAESHKGKSINENQKAALELGQHRTPTEEERKRIAESNRGKTRSAETRQKLSDARRRRVVTPETKQKTAESMRNYWAQRKAATSAGSPD